MISLNGDIVNIGSFPNGECYCDIDSDKVKCNHNEFNFIEMRFENDEDILFLSFLKDYLDDLMPNKPCDLFMPYIPYSRMDRVEENRLFTLKYFAKIVNRLNFRRVVVMEPHSDVSSALIDRIVVVNESDFLAKIAMRDSIGLVGDAWLKKDGFNDIGYNLENLYNIAKNSGVYIVLPDYGAEKRYKKQIDYPKILTCSKDRAFNDGKIRSTVIHGVENARDCKIAIIVDDLCSKGGTFMGVADALRCEIPTIEKVVLCVTHCENNIFNGFVLSSNVIDMVYTTDSILNVRKNIQDYETYRNKFKIIDTSEVYLNVRV